MRVICRQSQIYATACAGCGEEVELVTFPAAAKIVGESVDAVIEQAAKGNIHLGIRPEAMLVCLNSLLHVKEFSVAAGGGIYQSAKRPVKEMFH